MINYKSYGDLSRDIAAHLKDIPAVDLVVGIPKSGIVPAVMIASLKNTRLYDLDTFLFVYSTRSGVRKYSREERPKTRVLVVDDSVNTGAEFKRVRKRVEHLSSEYEFVFCAVYGTDPAASRKHADVVLTHVPQPRIFQWNYRNHIIAEHALFDMDGVLCVDPTDAENDDGEAYVNFMSGAAPLIIPTKTISAIVTSRLEKYRPQTEDWLHRNGVKFKELIMLDLPSAEERRRLRAHAPFKTEVYKSRGELLFVESNWKQARHIASAADKPVLCTENDILVLGSDHLQALEHSNKLPSADAITLEVGLRSKMKMLVDRLAVTDPYAAAWLERSGISCDPKRIADLTPFQKTRLVMASALGNAPADTEIAPKSRTAKRILMISVTFDVKKGAGAAASSCRLRDSLRDAGYDVHTLSMEDFPGRRAADVDQPAAGTHLGMWINYADGQHSNRLAEKISRIDPDCIVLGAVDRGIVSMFDLAQLRYPIVWVNRDNWAHTGGCLFKLPASEVETAPAVYKDYWPSLTCDQYKTGCRQCPALKDVAESGKTRTSFEIKRAVLSYRKDMVFAPISPWLAEVMRTAPLTSEHHIVTARNPIDLSVVKKLPSRPTSIRTALGLKSGEKVVLLAAHTLSNPRKGLKLVLQALAGDPRLKACTFVTMGEPMDAGLIPKGLKLHSLGFVESEEEKVSIYNAVDATLLPALQESLSVVASDSICCGTPVVAFKTSGVASFLVHERTGYLARPFDAKDLVDGLLWVLGQENSQELSSQCLAIAEHTFGARANVKALAGAIDQAIANFSNLGPIPTELEFLSNAMDLVNEDHQFRAAWRKRQARKVREFAEIQGMAPGKVYDQIFELKEKLNWNRGKVRSLEDDLKKSESKVEKFATQIEELKTKLEWNRKRREQLERGRSVTPAANDPRQMSGTEGP